MSSSVQTLIALGIVALAAAFLLRSWLRKKKSPGCGGECGAVSPEIRKLQAKLKR
ncbi:MAG: FeoB-associated Cys-rich membrane protein [Opitutae bacterium]|nr:FeoB-associated Cys-rich membrane protein [Opitutae bacterium]